MISIRCYYLVSYLIFAQKFSMFKNFNFYLFLSTFSYVFTRQFFSNKLRTGTVGTDDIKKIPPKGEN